MKETKGIFDDVLGFSEPLQEAKPIRVKDMDKSKDAIQNLMEVIFETYDSTAEELSRLVNARGDRINELVDEVASLEEQIIKLKTPKKKAIPKKKAKASAIRKKTLKR